MAGVIESTAPLLAGGLIAGFGSWMIWVSVSQIKALGWLKGIDEKMGAMANVGTSLTSHELADAHNFGRIDQRIEGVEKRMDDFLHRYEASTRMN